MLYAFIGAAAVVGALMGSVLLCVIWISGKVSDGIRSRTLELISAYDTLLETRSRELAEAEERIRRSQAVGEGGTAETAVPQVSPCAGDGGAALSAVARLGSASYRDALLGETYRRIRGAFRVEPAQRLRSLRQAAGKQTAGPATVLLDALPYDTVYRLSALPGEEQRRLLRECLDDGGRTLLDGYQAANGRFSGIGFYDYLQTAAAMEPHPPRLRVSPGDTGAYPAGVEVVADPDICEGCQIEYNNTLYDYSIRGRELS